MEEKIGIVGKIKNYLKETQGEAKKVSWPSRKYVMSATGIIIVMVLVLGVLLTVLDYGFSQAILTLTRIR